MTQSYFDDLSSLDESDLSKPFEQVQAEIDAQTQYANQPLEEFEEQTAEPTGEASAQQQQQQTEEPETEGDVEFLDNIVKDIKPISLNEKGNLEGGSGRHQLVHGVANTAVGLINMVPGVDIPKLPKYESELGQAASEISGLIVPSLLLGGLGVGLGRAANARVGLGIGKSALVQRVGEAGVAAGTGALVDYASTASEGDSASGYLKQKFPRTWGWLPNEIATLDGESPDEKRIKNVKEGVALGSFLDIAAILGKVYRAASGLRAGQYVPENELAANSVKTLNKPEVPAEEILEVGEATRSANLDELGRYNFENAVDFDQPIHGYHDVYSRYENGVRGADNGGVIAASVDYARIADNIDTDYGRVGSIMTEPALKAAITNGVAEPDTYYKTLKGLASQIELAGKYGYKTATGKYLSHADIMAKGDLLASDLMKMDVPAMRTALAPFQYIDGDIGTKVLKSEAYAGVFKAIKSYMDEFMNMDAVRAQAYLETSLGGQISDMAEGMRLMDGTEAVERAQEQILDRMEYLMTIKGQTSYARGRGLNMLNLWNRMTELGSKAAEKAGMTKMAKQIRGEKNSTLKAISKIAADSKQTVETLRTVSKEQPEMLGPLMMAYELTDGNVDNISKLNNWMRESSSTLGKAIIDRQPEIPSLMLQGVWANMYNSILSSIITPAKAIASGAFLLGERPVATAIGALATGNKYQLRKAGYVYSGMFETLGRAFEYSKFVTKKIANDPEASKYLSRQDFQVKNERAIEVFRATADAEAKRGNFGASVIADQIEAMNDMANSPFLKFGINAMSVWDGFVKSVIANWETRGKIFDEFVATGKQMTPEEYARKSEEVYSNFFDPQTNTLKEGAAKFASKEINMNLDGGFVDGLNVMLRHLPGLKPFLMFPSTSTSLLKYAGSHVYNPLGKFINMVNDYSRPFNQLDQVEAERLLKQRGFDYDEMAEINYEGIRSEILGRKAIGTMTVFGAVGLFTQDRLHGDGHFDKETQRVRTDLGWKPRTVKGLDGNWYSYADLGAIGDLLAFTANVMDNFDTLNPNDVSTLLAKSAHILGSAITEKSVLSGMEPMFDILSGNGASIARWGASFGSGALPLSGLRSQLARVISPAVRESEQELFALLASRNPGTRGQLPVRYGWVSGKPQGEENFFQRLYNAVSPLKVYGDITPEEQFLLDIEFDARPTLKTNGKGVDYTPEERSQVVSKMGEQGYFRLAIAAVMQTEEGQRFREAYKEAQSKGVTIDVSEFQELHRQLKTELRAAQQLAQREIDSADRVEEVQFLNGQMQRAQRSGDVKEIDRVQGLLDEMRTKY